jgi:serine protease Do
MLREVAAVLRSRPAAALALALVFGAIGVGLGTAVDFNTSVAKPAISSCTGEYADALQLPTVRARDIEQGPRSAYTYLVRSTARYECPYFAPDGKLRRRRVEAVEHGTAFAYEVQGTDTFLLTNEHVAVWPEVTDARNRVEGVGDGCKRVEEKLRLVHDQHDEDHPGHIPLQRVAFDPRLDAAILKAPQPLTVLPYRIGKSAALRQGNAVQVRGFPLGLLHAVNTGKVVNPYDADREQGWDHVDFVIDALLSEGNSGSPVLALSCRTGELELVGMYHAGYKEASALNVVVGIDQLRELMTKKRRIPRAAPDGFASLGAPERKKLEEALGAGALPLFEFGGLHVLAEHDGDLLRYHVHSRSFPLDDRRLAVVEDGRASGRFGDVQRLAVRGEVGWRAADVPALGEDERDLVFRLGEALRMHMLRVIEYRRLLGGKQTVEDRRRGRELLRAIERQATTQRELIAGFTDLVERLAPGRDGAQVAGGPGADAGVPPPPALNTRLSAQR